MTGSVHSGLAPSVPTEQADKPAGHTPGPWAWMGNQHDLYLATTHSGRRYVMGFDRMGFRSAQPTFRAGNRILPAAALVEFEVGDRGVRGFEQGKADDSVYRYDVIGIDNPDARLIAAAPELLEALDRCSAALQRLHTDVEALTADSEGVAGLHHHGDVAPWSELLEGGKYSDWLGDHLWAARNAYHDARNAIAKATGASS